MIESLCYLRVILTNTGNLDRRLPLVWTVEASRKDEKVKNRLFQAGSAEGVL